MNLSEDPLMTITAALLALFIFVGYTKYGSIGSKTKKRDKKKLAVNRRMMILAAISLALFLVYFFIYFVG